MRRAYTRAFSPTRSLGILGPSRYNFLVFASLKTAPSVEADLVNYLWPLLIIFSMPSCRAGDLCSGILQALYWGSPASFCWHPAAHLSAPTPPICQATPLHSPLPSYGRPIASRAAVSAASRQTQLALLAWLRVSARLWLNVVRNGRLAFNGRMACTDCTRPRSFGWGVFPLGLGPETRQRPCAWRHRLLRPIVD